MTKILISPRARQDLDGIWTYTASTWGDEQAAAYVRLLWRGISEVAADLRRSIPCDEIRTGYRRSTVGSHVVFFRSVPEGLLIVRILHQRMDFRRHLKGRP